MTFVGLSGIPLRKPLPLTKLTKSLARFSFPPRAVTIKTIRSVFRKYEVLLEDVQESNTPESHKFRRHVFILGVHRETFEPTERLSTIVHHEAQTLP